MIQIKQINILCSVLMVLSLTAAQQGHQQVRELPTSLTYVYRYGISPTLYMLALLARAGWVTTKIAAQGAWWTTKSVAQEAWNVGKFTYNYPITALGVIPGTAVMTWYALKKIQEMERQEQEMVVPVLQAMHLRGYNVKEDSRIQDFVQENSDIIEFLRDLDMGLLDQASYDEKIVNVANTIIFLQNEYRSALPDNVLRALAQFNKQPNKKAAARHILSTLFTINH